MEAYGPSAQKLRKSIKNKDYSVVLKHKNIPYIPLFLKMDFKDHIVSLRKDPLDSQSSGSYHLSPQGH